MIQRVVQDRTGSLQALLEEHRRVRTPHKSLLSSWNTQIYSVLSLMPTSNGVPTKCRHRHRDKTDCTEPLSAMLLPGMGIVKEKVSAVTPLRRSREDAHSYLAQSGVAEDTRKRLQTSFIGPNLRPEEPHVFWDLSARAESARSSIPMNVPTGTTTAITKSPTMDSLNR